MFSFLKEKIKNVVKSFTKKTEEEQLPATTGEYGQDGLGTEEHIETIKEKEKPEKTITKEKKISEQPQKKKEEQTKKEETKPEHKETEKKKILEPEQKKEKAQKKELEKIHVSNHKIQELKNEETKKEELPKEEPTKEGFFGRITKKFTTTTITQQQFEEFSEHLEIAMLENNTAYEVVEKIKTDLGNALIGTNISRGTTEETITKTLKKSIREILDAPQRDMLEESNKKKPYVICFVGINGSGKTTTIAKIAKKFIDGEKSVVLAGADTFRAAAIEQLQQHADTLGIKLIKHEYGSDPASVAFDAIAHAKQKDKDVVLIDTAGRLHSNTNLIDEMKKIKRVSKPDMTIFVGESITGNDCTEQAQQFNEAIGIDGIILTKADVDEKGGTPLSISYVTKKPILYIGTGQEYTDLKEFNIEEIVGKIV